MYRIGAAFVLVLLTSGCVSTEKMIDSLSKSKRSWCLYWAGTPGISGPVLASGSGIAPDNKADTEDMASADCSPSGHKVNMSGMGENGGGALRWAPPAAIITPSGDVILRTPRVLRQMPGELEDITPDVVTPPPARRAPAIRPQSAPAPVPTPPLPQLYPTPISTSPISTNQLSTTPLKPLPLGVRSTLDVIYRQNFGR